MVNLLLIRHCWKPSIRHQTKALNWKLKAHNEAKKKARQTCILPLGFQSTCSPSSSNMDSIDCRTARALFKASSLGDGSAVQSKIKLVSESISEKIWAQMFLPVTAICSPRSDPSFVPPTDKQEPVDSALAVNQMFVLFNGTTYHYLVTAKLHFKS